MRRPPGPLRHLQRVPLPRLVATNRHRPSARQHPAKSATPSRHPVASALRTPRFRAVSVAEMQAIDEAAIHEFGIPRLLLMEHAGLAVARAAQQLLSRSTGTILVCCGMGFNGGDGLCAARQLSMQGYRSRILVTGHLAQLREEPTLYAAMLQRLGLHLTEVITERQIQLLKRWFTHCDLIIDALLGIGARGPVRQPTAALITQMNHSDKPILAVDVPSGLNADTGVVQGIAVKATVTVTFGLPKRGCLTAEGSRHTGRLIINPLIFPRRLLEGRRRRI